MTRSSRRRIFYVLVALFFLVGGGIVFYAQGWRLDFTTWRFTKIGGIFVRSYPIDATITLDGEPIENQSGFLSAGTLISNLLPRTYHVALKADGYREWQENAAVLPSLVVQFKSAVLIPEKGISASTSTIKQISLPTPTSTKKIVTALDKISIFDVARATTTASFPIPGKNLSSEWITNNLLGILQTDGKLYLYNMETGALRQLADDVRVFSATEDGSMIAALENRSSEIFSLNDTSVYYRFNLPDIILAKDIIWYRDRSHVFVVYPDHVSFLDLADVSLRNFAMVATGTKPIYDAKTNTLYVTNPSSTKSVLGYQFAQ